MSGSDHPFDLDAKQVVGTLPAPLRRGSRPEVADAGALARHGENTVNTATAAPARPTLGPAGGTPRTAPRLLSIKPHMPQALLLDLQLRQLDRGSSAPHGPHWHQRSSSQVDIQSYNAASHGARIVSDRPPIKPLPLATIASLTPPASPSINSGRHLSPSSTSRNGLQRNIIAGPEAHQHSRSDSAHLRLLPGPWGRMLTESRNSVQADARGTELIKLAEDGNLKEIEKRVVSDFYDVNYANEVRSFHL